MRKLLPMLISIAGALGWSPAVFPQDVCDNSPSGDAQTLQASVWGGTLGGDPFGCGTSASPTPSTCTLYYRVYTDQESSCINREQGATPETLRHTTLATARLLA